MSSLRVLCRAADEAEFKRLFRPDALWKELPDGASGASQLLSHDDEKEDDEELLQSV